MSLTRKKYIAYQCARCFSTDEPRLAWFCGSGQVFDDCFLCKRCFSECFNKQTQQQKEEWGFYAEKQTTK